MQGASYEWLVTYGLTKKPRNTHTHLCDLWDCHLSFLYFRGNLAFSSFFFHIQVDEHA